MGGEAFLREKEKTIADLTSRLNEAESLVSLQKTQLDKLSKSAEADRERTARLTAASEQMSVELLAERRRSEDVAVKLEQEKKRALAAEASVSLKGSAEAKARLAEAEELRGRLAAAAKDLEAERRRGDELTAKLASQAALLEAERKRAASAEAAGAAKGGSEARARQAETDELRAKLAAVTRDLETERKRASVSDKQLEELRQKLESAAIQVDAEKKRSMAQMESAQKGDKSTAARLVESEKLVQELQNKLAAVTRELSGQQLAVIELSNRLRDAEAPTSKNSSGGSVGGGSQDGELKSLQMQLVAMEQDYESQLDELRAELEEARVAAGGTGSGGAVGSGSEDSAGQRLRKSTKIVAEQEKAIEKLRARVAELEQQKQELAAVPPSPMRGLPFKNPLMDAPAASSPFPAEEFEKLTGNLRAMQALQDCVWMARMTFDERGVASACGLILRHVTDDDDAEASLDKMAVAIEAAALNQLSLLGKMYWLNAGEKPGSFCSFFFVKRFSSDKSVGLAVQDGDWRGHCVAQGGRRANCRLDGGRGDAAPTILDSATRAVAAVCAQAAASMLFHLPRHCR